jgi:hypothetical protein
MRIVPLHGAKARGRVAWVSECDYDRVIVHRWWVHEVRRPSGKISGPYAWTWVRLPDGTLVQVRMHQMIMGVGGVDHRNRYPLDNTRPNLREATPVQQQHNQGSRGGTSAYKGVSWNTRRGKWVATIRANYRKHHLGYFTDEADAARAYNVAAVELHGAFAVLNVIPAAA